MQSSSSREVTFILVHGSGFGGWIWDNTIPLLSHPAIAIDLPGRKGKHNTYAFEDYVQMVLDAIHSAKSQKVILVGHSIGLEFVLDAASQTPERIAAIVSVAGLVPKSGASYYSLFSPVQRSFLKLLAMVYRNGLRPPNGMITKAYANDLDQTHLDEVLRRYSYESPHIFSSPVMWATIPTDIPRYYIAFTDDKSGFSPQQQSDMAHRLGAKKVFRVKTGHLGMIKEPAAVAGFLNQCATA